MSERNAGPRGKLRRPEIFKPNAEDVNMLKSGKIQFESEGAFPTSNNMGFSFQKLDDGVRHWISSLPFSEKPLLDLGSGRGFQTLAAIKAGRKVVSVDCCHQNLAGLRQYVDEELGKQPNVVKDTPGKLMNTVFATLPSREAFPSESAAGILLSEVIHFVPNDDVITIFKDAYHWLEKKGLLVVTTASPACLPIIYSMQELSITEEELNAKMEFVSNATDSELISKPVFLAKIPQPKAYKIPSPKFMQIRSTEEIFALANLAGFKVLNADYISPGKYPFRAFGDEVTLLVALKPE